MTDEAHLSAEQSGSQAPARLSRTYGDRWRPQYPACAPFAWPQEPERLSDSAVLPGKMTRRADYLAANRGQRQTTPGFILLVRDRRDGDPAVRLGITVSKKVGGAVVRNRMKRRFRVLGQELLGAHALAGSDHVLIGRREGVERDFTALREELQAALARAARKAAKGQGAR
jgi:ribonuclease P protein component